MSESDSTIPYGYCQCGCGGKTSIAKYTSKRDGWIKGQPVRYINGHGMYHVHQKLVEECKRQWKREMPDIPYGYCWCGCGQSTPPARITDRHHGYVVGTPVRFLPGHHGKAKVPHYQPAGESSSVSLAIVGFRTCTSCECTKPLSREFFRWVNGRGGFYEGKCLICSRLWERGWRKSEEYRAWRRGYQKRLYAKNPEAILERNREWRRDNPEKARETNKLSNERWLKKIKADEDRWRKERIRVRTKENRRRARKQGTGGSHTAEDVQQMYRDQKGLCAYCEAPLNGIFHQDHMIPISRGGSDDVLNIAVVCPPCNLRKSARTVGEFFAIA